MKRKPTSVITRVRTGNGDFGLTTVGSCQLNKSDPVVKALAQLQVCQASVGSWLHNLEVPYSSTVRLCRDILYEIGAGIHIIMDDRTDNERLDKLQSLYDNRHEALEAAMSWVIGDGLSLSGFIMADAHSAAGALSTAFVRQLECDIVAMGTLRVMSFNIVDIIRKIVNTMSDLLFVVDVRTREGEQDYWEGLGF